MNKKDLIDLINQHGIQDFNFETTSEEDVVMFVLRMRLKNDQEFTFEQDVEFVRPRIRSVRVQENVKGDLEPRMSMTNRETYRQPPG